MKRTEKTIIYAQSKLGGKYSQEYRWRNDPYTRDCSSYVWSAYDAAGYKMKDTISTYEVYDPGFKQLWPPKGQILGKQFGDMQAIMTNGYRPTAGDLIFYATTKTTRANKITHVSIVENATHILHARGTKYGIRRDPITLYSGKIVAIIRLKSALNIEVDQPTMAYKQATCTGNGVNIRKEPTTHSLSLGKLYKGNTFQVQPLNKDWYKITVLMNEKMIVGYIHSNYIDC